MSDSLISENYGRLLEAGHAIPNITIKAPFFLAFIYSLFTKLFLLANKHIIPVRLAEVIQYLT